MRFRSVVALAAASTLAACSTPSPQADSPSPQTSADGSRLLRVGETVSGTLEEADPTWGGNGRFDAYRFQANEGDRVLIRLASDDFDPYLVVGTESGGIFDPLQQNDDSGEELNSRIHFTAPRTGTYRVLAQAYAEYGLGTYTLSLEPVVPSAVESASIAIGSSVDGYLDDDDNFDQFGEIWFDAYTFQAQAGRRYSITMTSEDFDAYLILGSGSGEQFEEVSRNDDSGEGYDSRILYTPAASGTYTIRAASYDGEGTGAYVLRVTEVVSGPFVVTPLSLGRSVSASLDESDQVAEDGSYFDVYSFSGRAGDRVEIVMRSDALDSYVEVGEPVAAGEEFFAEYSDDDSGGNVDARVRMTLPRDGEYQVRAYSLYPDETGDYTIELREPTNTPASVTPIRVGQTVQGTLDDDDPALDDGSRYRIYIFDGRAGQDVRITLRSADFDSFLQFGYWEGEEIDVTYSDDDSGEGETGLDSMLELTLPGTRTYAIMVNTVYGDEVGDFSLTLEPNE